MYKRRIMREFISALCLSSGQKDKVTSCLERNQKVAHTDKRNRTNEQANDWTITIQRHFFRHLFLR